MLDGVFNQYLQSHRYDMMLHIRFIYWETDLKPFAESYLKYIYIVGNKFDFTFKKYRIFRIPGKNIPIEIRKFLCISDSLLGILIRDTNMFKLLNRKCGFIWFFSSLYWICIFSWISFWFFRNWTMYSKTVTVKRFIMTAATTDCWYASDSI